ncbi:Flagellar hook-basal body complex protein FliE [Buchnera aphidicola (Cinara pseudotaxifoliae)]|uniref:Flagellar hook-basal body complex protein FliE n=1 Tax=Buchnera aphidicola (Cinara pseudotaxifoliae) TaxID=655384 RepID=A0A451DG71_9GAMM|nr:hypothetical protein [Buchnera aphidicola]VFP85614.1 Flagellar hook-basal body complex protein FliE [Buchnera aphidicola (Cinara pseudotaxifoliae)]
MKINSVQPQSIKTTSFVSHPKKIKNKNFSKVWKNVLPKSLDIKKTKNQTKNLNSKKINTTKIDQKYKINVFLNIQNKLISLYEEIMNMQI